MIRSLTLILMLTASQMSFAFNNPTNTAAVQNVQNNKKQEPGEPKYTTQIQGNNLPTPDDISRKILMDDLVSARKMVETVIESQPNSAVAHYLYAEVAARTGMMNLAKQEITTAKSLSAGLAFVPPATVQKLEHKISTYDTALQRAVDESNKDKISRIIAFLFSMATLVIGVFAGKIIFNRK